MGTSNSSSHAQAGVIIFVLSGLIALVTQWMGLPTISEPTIIVGLLVLAKESFAYYLTPGTGSNASPP
jgi:hypothetical protein